MPSKPDRSYQLKADEELAEGLKRIAGGRAKKAIERLGTEGDRAEAIHGARKDMKKLRTVLRLARDELPEELYAEENRRFRDAARALAASRDAEVKLETLDALAEEAELPEEAVEAWRAILDRDREAATNTADGEAALSLIEAGLAGIQRWPLEGDSWSTIGAAVRRSYRRGRRAMTAAEAEPTGESLHQWRKRAKDLWYELRLLSGAWSGPLESVADEAHRLTDLLGEHHDLGVLRSDLEGRLLGGEATRALTAAICERQEQFANQAFDLGHRLYAERPKAFNRRLRRYWRAWRG